MKDANGGLVFIVGVPRSGTTWVWGILTSHPDVVSLDRTNFDRNNPSVIDGRRVTSETGAFMNYDDLTIQKVIERKMSENPGKTVVEKTPKHIYHIERIFKLFPKSKIIHVLRDPRAVISSMLNTKFARFTSSLGDAIEQYESALESVNKYKSDERMLTVRYEDLSNNFSPEVDKILGYLNLERSHEIVKTIESENIKKTKVDISGFLRKGLVDSYKEDLTKEQLISIESRLGEQLKSLGYGVD